MNLRWIWYLFFASSSPTAKKFTSSLPPELHCIPAGLKVYFLMYYRMEIFSKLNLKANEIISLSFQFFPRLYLSNSSLLISSNTII